MALVHDDSCGMKQRVLKDRHVFRAAGGLWDQEAGDFLILGVWTAVVRTAVVRATNYPFSDWLLGNYGCAFVRVV